MRRRCNCLASIVPTGYGQLRLATTTNGVILGVCSASRLRLSVRALSRKRLAEHAADLEGARISTRNRRPPAPRCGASSCKRWPRAARRRRTTRRRIGRCVSPSKSTTTRPSPAVSTRRQGRHQTPNRSRAPRPRYRGPLAAEPFDQGADARLGDWVAAVRRARGSAASSETKPAARAARPRARASCRRLISPSALWMRRSRRPRITRYGTRRFAGSASASIRRA